MKLASRLLRLEVFAVECKAVSSSVQAPIHQYCYGRQYDHQLLQTESVPYSNGPNPVTGYRYLYGSLSD